MEPENSFEPQPTEQMPPKRKITKTRLAMLLAACLLVVALVIAYRITDKDTSQKDSTTVTQPETLETAQVGLTNQGFSPQTITIKVGQSVVWTNQDTLSRQIAADPHPVHENLAGFTVSEPLQSGDSFSFTFDEKGTYTFHDESKPLEFKGTVIVE